MVQGDAYSIDVEITNEGQTLSPSAVSLVEIALLNLVKTYPGDVTFSDGKFHFPLTQPETFGLPTVCPMQVRVKFPRFRFCRLIFSTRESLESHCFSPFPPPERTGPMPGEIVTGRRW